MGMDWLKGLVGASDQMIPAGQQYPAGQQQYPAGQGWSPPQPYGAPAAGPPAAGPPTGGGVPAPAAQGAPAWGQPPAAAYAPPAAAYTPPWGAPAGAPGAAPSGGVPGGTPAWGTPSAASLGAVPGAPGPADARVAALEARCDELRKDIESLSLFARTLLTLLEEKQVVTQQQFQETKQKLDMLDGKLDDRIAPGS